MVVQHNIMALNAYNRLASNNTSVSSNLEKLSSGYKINRAGDDAAGLAISEKMRAQITGLERASDNAQDGISLVQTAEGALTEVHSMLNRMVELATQSSNGTYDNDTDRANLQKEVESLQSEIDRIAKETNFNGINLLDGSLNKAATTVTGKQLVDVAAKLTGVTTADGRQDKLAAGNVFSGGAAANIDALAKNDRLDAFEISFVNSKGETKTITLAEGAVNGIAADTAVSLADALSGRSAGLSLTGVNNDPDDLAEFRELFDITAVSNAGAGTELGIKIQAKDADSGASLVSLKTGTGASVTAAVTAANTATAKTLDATSTKAESAGYYVDLNTGVTAGTGTTLDNGMTLKIGNTTYEIGDAAHNVEDGNVKVALGATDKVTVDNLVAQLKKDGFSLEVSGNDATKLIFTNMSQLSTDQGGVQISASSANVQIDKLEAAKQSTDITIASATTGSTHSLTFNYVDADGKAQAKTISYDAITGDPETATAITDAINDDADLVKLFKVTDDGSGKITIEARGTGTEAGQFTGIATTDSAMTQVVEKTAGAEEGKTVQLKSGENLKSGDTITVDGKTYEFTTDSSKAIGSGNIRVSIGTSGKETMENFADALTEAGVNNSIDANGKLTFADADAPEQKAGLSLQIGDTASQRITVSISDMSSKTLGVDASAVNIGTEAGATAAIQTIKDAINTVSSTRANLGAIQNRLEHTINNLATTTENMTSAESRIRDTDMAKEMMAYTKNNVLSQAAQAMLAQANQQPQQVLQLLQ